MKMDYSQLRSLYQDASKHSVYQNIPKFVQMALGYREKINEEWRGDTARYKYILKILKDERITNIVDIGANTGFFSHSLAHDLEGLEVTAIEPNKSHADFIREINSIFNLKQINVINSALEYKDIDQLNKKFDCGLLLNVLHHAGVDFDEGEIQSPDEFWSYFRKYCEKLGVVFPMMILQLGYNWGGDKGKPIVSPDNLVEMMRGLIINSMYSSWRIKKVAYYIKEQREYIEVPEEIIDGFAHSEIQQNEFKAWCSIKQIELNSEFYKRPLVTLTFEGCLEDNS